MGRRGRIRIRKGQFPVQELITKFYGPARRGRIFGGGSSKRRGGCREAAAIGFAALPKPRTPISRDDWFGRVCLAWRPHRRPQRDGHLTIGGSSALFQENFKTKHVLGLATRGRYQEHKMEPLKHSKSDRGSFPIEPQIHLRDGQIIRSLADAVV